MKNKIFKSLVNLPAPKNISYFWRFGSMLGVCLTLQIITGLFLSVSYTPHVNFAFSRVIKIIIDRNFLRLIQVSHANGASLFFVFIYIHIGRGLYYQSYKLAYTWVVGVILFFLTIITAFLGYVLPWGQISFWGAIVITNLLSTIPYLGNTLVIWLWGGFSVDNATLNRFFIFHFLLPFIITIFSVLHLFFLHKTGSRNPLGLKRNTNKISFFPYFVYKDILGFIFLFIVFIVLILYYPYFLGDSDNFLPSNPISTPVHIQPEWYFLFAYAILRSIPNKLGGTIALIFSIAILFFIPIFSTNKFKGREFYFLDKFLFWTISITVILLTWIGISAITSPYIIIGQFLTIAYFALFVIYQLLLNYWNNFIS